jgi:uncharacterized protein
MHTKIAVVHLLAVYAIVAAPFLGRAWYEKARRRIEAGDRLAKIKLYRAIVLDQIITTVVVLGLRLFGGISGARLGLGAPWSWWLSVGSTVLLGGLLAWSGVRLRVKAPKIREKLKDRADALLPGSPEERCWFAAVSVGAGISEELIFRGFLFYYFSLWFPHINGVENALVTSLIFGLGHLYQGWKGIVSAGVSGLILAGMYVLTGNLLLPIVVHAVGDLRVLWIFPAEAEGAVPAGSAA